MTKGRVRLTPENCPEHKLVLTMKGAAYWVYQCDCGYWETHEQETVGQGSIISVRARYKKRDDEPGKAIRIDYSKE